MTPHNTLRCVDGCIVTKPVKFWAIWSIFTEVMRRPCFMASIVLPWQRHLKKPHNWRRAVEGWTGDIQANFWGAIGPCPLERHGNSIWWHPIIRLDAWWLHRYQTCQCDIIVFHDTGVYIWAKDDSCVSPIMYKIGGTCWSQYEVSIRQKIISSDSLLNSSDHSNTNTCVLWHHRVPWHRCLYLS